MSDASLGYIVSSRPCWSEEPHHSWLMYLFLSQKPPVQGVTSTSRNLAPAVLTAFLLFPGTLAQEDKSQHRPAILNVVGPVGQS